MAEGTPDEEGRRFEEELLVKLKEIYIPLAAPALARASGTLFPPVRSRRAGREAGALTSLQFTSLEMWR